MIQTKMVIRWRWLFLAAAVIAGRAFASEAAFSTSDAARDAVRVPAEERLLCVPALVTTTDEARALAGASLWKVGAAISAPAQTSASPSTTDEARAAASAAGEASDATTRLANCGPTPARA